MSDYFPEQRLSLTEIQEFREEFENLVKSENQKFISFRELDSIGNICNYWLSEYSLTNYYVSTNKNKYWKLKQTINVANEDMRKIINGFMEITKNANIDDSLEKENFFFRGIIAAQKHFSQDNERLYYWSENTDEITEFNEKLLEQIELNEAFHQNMKAHENMKARMKNPNKRWQI